MLLALKNYIKSLSNSLNFIDKTLKYPIAHGKPDVAYGFRQNYHTLHTKQSLPAFPRWASHSASNLLPPT